MRVNLIVTRGVGHLFCGHNDRRVLELARPISVRRVLRRNTPGALALRLLRYPYALLRDLSRGQINLYAMGLVYATLLSLVPLIAFAFAVLKAFGAHRELAADHPRVLQADGRQRPPEFTQQVMEFADSVSTGAGRLAWVSRCCSGPC